MMVDAFLHLVGHRDHLDIEAMSRTSVFKPIDNDCTHRQRLGRILSYLLRLKHLCTNLPPGDFVDTADHFGSITEILFDDIVQPD